jgi:phage-related protein
MFGHELGLPHSKNIAKNLFELRVRGTQEVRLFYAFHERKALILHGFIKKSKRIPARELQIANKKLKDLEGL